MFRRNLTHLRQTVRVLTLALLVLAAFGAAGCAHAEYDIIRPADLAQHVGTKQYATAALDPLEYQMIAYEDHLIVRINNRSDEPIQLIAEQSAAIDPRGESHPLPVRNQTIFPGSRIKLILPPAHPRVVPSGPTIGIGIGGVFGSARPLHGRYYSAYGYGYGFDPFLYGPPRYYAVYGGDDSPYWSWPDGGTVRLILVFQRAPAIPPPGSPAPPAGPDTRPAGGPPHTFTHEFVIRQKKV